MRTTESERPLVGFHVGEGYFAVDVPTVREIIAPAPLVSVPHSSPIVRGVTDHRGRVVPVVDLRKRFGLASANETRRTKWVIVEVPQGPWLGLVVDDVTEVFNVTAANERSAPRLGPDDVARGFSRVYVHDKTLVLVLDLMAIARAVELGGGAVSTPSWKPAAGGEGTS
jgi:purine-binding chemotaxis protein CheW